MNDFLQQLHDLVPAFNVASIPRDASGVFASPVHIIAGLLNKKLETIKKIKEISANVNLNCTRMKVIVNGIEQRNTIMVGTAESIMRVLTSCDRQNMAAIVARLPVVVQVQQASVPLGTHNRPPPSVAPAPQASVPFGTPARPPLFDGQAPLAPAPAHVQQIKKPLVLNGMVIEVDPVTSMVNATQMCQAAGKFYANYSHVLGAEDIAFVQRAGNWIFR